MQNKNSILIKILIIINQKVENFHSTLSKKQRNVAEKLNSECARQITQNWLIIMFYCKNIIVCNRLQLSIWGKKDLKKINSTKEEDKSKRKFCTLLKCKANIGDTILKDHLNNGATND